MGKFIERSVRFVPDLSILENQTTEYPTGYFAGWASTPYVDWYDSVILDGAFSKSIERRGVGGSTGVKLLAHHDMSKPAGVIRRLEYRDNGLWIEGQLGLNISYAKDLYEAAKLNGGLNLSVGFNVIDSYLEKRNDETLQVIKEADLIEVSVVTFPANEQCEMVVVREKGCSTLSEFEKRLVSEGIVSSRRIAHRMVQEVKRNQHLFIDFSRSVSDSEIEGIGNALSHDSPSPGPDTPPLADVRALELSKLREKLDEIRKIIVHKG